LHRDALQVEILFTASKTLDPSIQKVTFDKYMINSIPTFRESLHDTQERLLLGFKDTWTGRQTHSDPEKEGDYILSLLSLILETKIDLDSTKVNNVQTTIRKKRSPFLKGKIELPSDLAELFQKLRSLDLDTLRQYIRSCDAYRTALSLIDVSPTLSFFLLVTAVEAMAGKAMALGSNRRNFTEFIYAYLPKSFENELGSKELLRILVEQAYNMRNAFTHGGAQMSIATALADDLSLMYMKHYARGKESYSPSIQWFERVARAVLLNFLRKRSVKKGKKVRLSKLAREEGIINVSATTDVKAGQVVRTSDLDLKFKASTNNEQ